MRRFFLPLALLVCVCGCREQFVPVSGQVKLDGQPLAGAQVLFFPEGESSNPGPGSQGRTDAQGRFSLQLMTSDTRGAVIGKHKVVITAREAPADTSNANPAPSKERVPAEYNANSQLFFEVPLTGTASAVFDLKTPPPPQ